MAISPPTIRETVFLVLMDPEKVSAIPWAGDSFPEPLPTRMPG
jgi:hypothetical protein